MAQPILILASGSAGELQKTTPHLLPCRLHHNGSVEPVASFWDPQDGEDGAKTAYFRGRKLLGKAVKLPEGYRGVVAAAPPTEEEKPAADIEVVDLVEDGRTPQAAMHVQACFDEMVVWGHEAAVDASADPYVRGMEEWLTLADQIHSYPAPKKQGS